MKIETSEWKGEVYGLYITAENKVDVNELLSKGN